MDATLQTFLGNLSSKETPKSEPQPADTQEQVSEAVQKTVNEPMPNRRMKLRKRYAASAASNAGHHWRNTRKSSFPFRPSKTASPYSSAATRAMLSTASSACLVNAG